MVDGEPKTRGRPRAAVDPNTPGGRLRALRVDAGLSSDQLGEILGVDRSMVSKYETGKHDIGPDILLRLARRFDASPTHILFGEPVVFAERTAPVVGRVGAGAEIEAIQSDNPDLVEVPSEYDDAQVFDVSGDSCYPVFEEGDRLVVRGPPRANETEFLNRFCVVQTAEGLGYVKRVVPGVRVPGLGALYTLESPNAPDIPNQQIVSARPVTLRILRSGR